MGAHLSTDLLVLSPSGICLFLEPYELFLSSVTAVSLEPAHSQLLLTPVGLTSEPPWASQCVSDRNSSWAENQRCSSHIGQSPDRLLGKLSHNLSTSSGFFLVLFLLLLVS